VFRESYFRLTLKNPVQPISSDKAVLVVLIGAYSGGTVFLPVMDLPFAAISTQGLSKAEVTLPGSSVIGTASGERYGHLKNDPF
jgi:hypothetical protein